MKYDEALPFAKINAESDDCMIWRCANKLHNDIFAVQNKQICEPVTVNNIVEGKAIPPDLPKASLKCFTWETFQQMKNFHQRNIG